MHRGDTTIKGRWASRPKLLAEPAGSTIAQVAKEKMAAPSAPVEQSAGTPKPSRPRKWYANVLSPANLVAGNIHRLRDALLAYGLASQLPDGRWRVPSDLIAQLESRERTHSRSRLQIDKFSPPQRQPAAPSITDLEKERMTIGEGVAQRLGLAFVANPQRFRGQLVPAPAGSSGTEYVRLSTYRHRQLALVPKPKDAERLRGKGRDRRAVIRRSPAFRFSSVREISAAEPCGARTGTAPTKKGTHPWKDEEGRLADPNPSSHTVPRSPGRHSKNGRRSSLRSLPTAAQELGEIHGLGQESAPTKMKARPRRSVSKTVDFRGQ